MPVPYHYFKVEEFPELDLQASIKSVTQLAMPWGDEQAHTTLTYLGVAEDERFERYAIEHQVDVEVDAIFNRQAIKRIIEIRRFPAYLFRSKGYLLASTGKRDAKGAFDRLAAGSPAVRTEGEEFDLHLITTLGQTTGGWFGKLQIADVRSVAVFGTDTVVDSEEWSRYLEAGELKNMYMKVSDSDGVSRTVMLGKDRLVLLMQPRSERENLEFVAHLQESINQVLPPEASSPSESSG